MEAKGIMARPRWQQRECPFCHIRLGRLETLKRKVRRVCKCMECGRIIDERFIVR